MDHTNPDEIKKFTRKMINIFIALLVLTVVTIAASYIHVGFAATVFIALLIATVKGSLVAGYFMHLSDEKKIIYSVLIMSAIFFAVLIALPIFQHLNGLDTGK